ncbi:hypothetical protein EDF56_101154 [Novosphingobium sp. PhB165]|uniref:hypothetical protein n=1 Tax=Novosphingobium sp. PhB165 TaxID=2485105 RepID=UPI001049F1E8|nr:hypothetical protein [Novosphingobium sp. PhB165]TCM21490.1 hypothetical protein EDF56_101154 [Novosphingobium sp. PhB165]
MTKIDTDKLRALDEAAMTVWRTAHGAFGLKKWQQGAMTPEAHPAAAAVIKAALQQARAEALKEVLRALPDEIDLFRIIRAAGRKDADKARAVLAALSRSGGE